MQTDEGTAFNTKTRTVKCWSRLKVAGLPYTACDITVAMQTGYTQKELEVPEHSTRRELLTDTLTLKYYCVTAPPVARH